MTVSGPAGSPGPHVFVDDLDAPVLNDHDTAHLERSLRMRPGDPLSVSDGRGSFAHAAYRGDGHLDLEDAPTLLPAPEPEVTVAFALVKSSKPELAIQKLTELGVDHIVVLQAERTVVRWDSGKVESARKRWERVVREASMQSHRVRLPSVEALIPASEYLRRPDVARADFGVNPVNAAHRIVAIGPEGGWAPAERELGSTAVSLGPTVLRAETAAITAGVLLTGFRDARIGSAG